MPEIFCLFICPYATFAKQLLCKGEGENGLNGAQNCKALLYGF